MMMTGRYTRKPVPLEVRGLSRGSLDEHPTISLERPVEQSLPVEYLRTVAEALSSYSHHETPVGSGRSSPTATEETQSTASTAHGCWTTGNTTERSSVTSSYYWDEHERQAAKTVQQLFEEIDSVLFEQNLDGPSYIKNECQEWGDQFPHIRILGRQVLAPQDTGYCIIERESSRPSSGSMGLLDVTDHDIAGTQDLQGLSVSGKHLSAIQVPVEARSRHDSGINTPSSDFSYLEEEIFDQDGEYEEIIAVDFKDIYEDNSDKKQLTPRRRRIGYPPITPNACVKDSVASSVFDNMWQEIMAWIRAIWKQYSSRILEDSKPHTSQQESHNDPLPPSREISNILPRFQYGQIPRAHTHLGSFDLSEGVLTISRKQLQIREKSSLQDLSESQVLNTTRPASSIHTGPGGGKRPPSTRLARRGGFGRLAPIDRAPTPSVDERNALSVKKISIPFTLPSGSDRLSPPPTHSLTRNGTLPPIGHMDFDPASSSRFPKKISNRASSAVDKDLRVPFKGFGLGGPNVDPTRPSTTHAMRADTPLAITRRASTPFGMQNNVLPNRSAAFGPGLGITGSGLQPSSDISHLGHVMEDSEDLDDVVHHNQWAPAIPSNNPYQRALKARKLQSSTVRS